MNQTLVRDKLKNMIEETGTTQAFLCRKFGIPAPILSLFLKGKKELFPEHLEAINTYMEQIKVNLL